MRRERDRDRNREMILNARRKKLTTSAYFYVLPDPFFSFEFYNKYPNK